MSFRNNFNPILYFIADSSCCKERDIADVVASAIKGGTTMVQFRHKSGDIHKVKEEALAIKKILADSSIPFLINDYVEIAAEINADGVHIGQDDMTPQKARKIIGDGKILGLTAFTKEHFDHMDPTIIDYVGTGPFFHTLTKPDKEVLGSKGFAQLAKDSPVPIVGIGGITADNAAEVMKAGADGVAMMRSISEADDPCKAAQELLKSVSCN